MVFFSGTMANPPVMQMRRPFDPVAHDLDEGFRLTKFVDIRGKCKVPQEVVHKLVEGLKVDIMLVLPN